MGRASFCLSGHLVKTPLPRERCQKREREDRGYVGTCVALCRVLLFAKRRVAQERRGGPVRRRGVRWPAESKPTLQWATRCGSGFVLFRTGWERNKVTPLFV